VAKTLTAVKSLGPVTVLVAGQGGDAAAAEAATLAGVAKVLFADDHAYCHGCPNPPPRWWCRWRATTSTSSPLGCLSKSVLPRGGAARRDGDLEVLAWSMARPSSARSMPERDPDRESSDAKKVMTIRTATFDAAGKGGSAPVEKVSASVDGGRPGSRTRWRPRIVPS
jgi:electron transfer flavoprotein alpha subunit